MKSFALVAAVAGLAGLAQAHMEMIYPPPFKSKANPYAGYDIDYSMTSPLDASGANFPCKGYLSLLGTDAGKPVATWNAGETYNMTITGGANHNGGSCQAVLSFDQGKTWTVIHSYIGGCPATGTSSLDFTLPADTPSGLVIFGWTWFNRVGNREMYMNCAAITVAGGSGSGSTAMSSRPSMFVANTNNGCKTTEGSDLEFPDPGPDVSDQSSNTSPPVGSCPAGSGSGSGSGSGGGSNGGGNSGAPTSAAQQPPATTSQPGNGQPPSGGDGAASSVYVSPSDPASDVVNTSSPPTSSPGGVFVTVSEPAGETEAPVSPPTSAPAVSEPATPPAEGSSTLITITRPTGGSGDVPTTPPPSNPSNPAPTSNPGNGSGSGQQTPGTPCADEGQWNCIGGSSFQRCASGQWSVVMSMAAGTSCESGISMNFVIHKKRRGIVRRFAEPWKV